MIYRVAFGRYVKEDLIIPHNVTFYELSKVAVALKPCELLLYPAGR